MAAKDDDRDDYQTVVYKKGAWVVHMLRVLTLDLRTMGETKFTETMTDFYRSYEGQRASTDDFRRVVERHVGTDMRWFFDQWVHGAGIPTYRVATRIQAGSDGQFQVMLRVKQEDVPDDFMMYVPVTVDLGKDQVARVPGQGEGAPHRGHPPGLGEAEGGQVQRLRGRAGGGEERGLGILIGDRLPGAQPGAPAAIFPQRRTVTTTPTPECHGHTHHHPPQVLDPPG